MTPTASRAIDRDPREKLVPVLLYVCGLSRPSAIGASLSFMSICHNDCRNGIRFSGILSEDDEARCRQLLDDIIGRYLAANRLPITVQARIIETAHEIIIGMPDEYRLFIQGRLFEICDGDHYQTYWEKFENPACLENTAKLKQGIISALQLKNSTDFAALIIALALLHGCRDDFYERIAVLEERLKVKYRGKIPFERLCLFLWPLDFSFLPENEDGNKENDEHRSLLEAMRTVNPGVKVQVYAESLLWPRDIIAWVSDDYETYVAPANASPGRFACGIPDEGGSVITGTAIDKFVLVTQGSFPDSMSEVLFRYEMDKRDIRTYLLPDGFLWSRDPRSSSGKNYALDSIHLDTVINFIPSSCTADNRPKVIVDPWYYALTADSEGFNAFLREQGLTKDDLVIVDERECHLNLPNFSLLLDQEGNKRFLFNKDRGFTIPRLRLKAGLMVQPAVEITRMASFFGSIRCATNMLPEPLVKKRSPLTVAVSDDLPSETKKLLLEVFPAGDPHIEALSYLFVSRLAIQQGPRETPWEYDEFSQTAYLYLAPDKVSDPDACCRAISEYIPAFARMLTQRLGIN